MTATTSRRDAKRAVAVRSSLGGRRPTALVALGLAVGSLAGCAFGGGGGARAAAEDDRVPVPDEVLFDAVSEIPGVVRADLSYEDDVTDGSTYFGDIEVDADADPACVLDRAYALLWQGRDASVSVSVIQDGAYTQEDAIGVEGNQFMGEMEERYGRRPKDGVFVEPDTPPACR